MKDLRRGEMKRVLKFSSRVIGFCLALIGLLMGAFLFLILCLGIVGFIISPKTDVGGIKANWSVELPYGYKTVENLDTEPSFHGDGFRFHLFQYRQDKKLDDILEWQVGPNEKFESEVEKILVELKANQYVTLFDQEYYYFYLLGDDQMSNLYIIWILQTNQVAVIEEII